MFKVYGRRRASVVVAGVGAIAALCGSGLTSTAAADRSDCPAQYFCLWDGPTYGSDRVQFHDNGWQNLTNFGFNDRASSVYNNTNRYARFSVDINGGGSKYCLGPGGYASLSGTGWDNVASAVDLDPVWAC